MQVWHRLLREPLAHFAALALLLFAGQALFAGKAGDVIYVDKATQDYLIKQRSELLLREMTEEEKQSAIDNYIEQEILVREARKQGFDSSSRIRRLLVQNMRFFIAGNIGKPSEQELREFFDANIERFTSPPSLDLDHVYFKGAPPAETLEKLKAGLDHAKIGDLPDARGRQLRWIDQRQLVGIFGSESASQVLAIKDNQWNGPLRSPRGYHFIRVVARNAPRPPGFDPASSWLEAEWVSAKNRELTDREVVKFKRDYRVIVEKRF